MTVTSELSHNARCLACTECVVLKTSKHLCVVAGCMLQAEPRAQLSLASRSASQNLKISPQDLILYSAKVSRAFDGAPVGSVVCFTPCLLC